MRERDHSLDILRGIGISLMVFDHVGWGSLVHTYIQSFHMPLFFIVSGYLWRNENMMEHFRNRFKTLMVPYACFSVCYLCLQMFPVFNGGNSFLASLKAILLFPTDIDNMPIAPALWFLPCMFLSTIAYSILSKLKWGLKALIIVAIVVAGMLYSSLSDIMLPFAIEPFTVALGFMLVGEFIRRKQDNVMNSIDKSWVIFVLLVMEAVLAIVNKSVDLRSARYHNCILYTINSITGTLAYWGIARKIKLICAKIPWGVQQLSLLSRNAMGFICMNQLFITIFDCLFKSILPSGTLVVVAGKAMTFVAVMVVVSCTTKIIKNSSLKMILGGR